MKNISVLLSPFCPLAALLLCVCGVIDGAVDAGGAQDTAQEGFTHVAEALSRNMSSLLSSELEELYFYKDRGGCVFSFFFSSFVCLWW